MGPVLPGGKTFFQKIGAALSKFLTKKVVSWTLTAATVVTGVKGFRQMSDMLSKGQDIMANKTAAGGKIPIIYGTRKVGAQVVYMDTAQNRSRDLFVVYAISVGECEEIIGRTIEIDGNSILDGNIYKGGGYVGSDKISSGSGSLNTASQVGDNQYSQAGTLGTDPTKRYSFVFNLHHGASSQTADPMLRASIPNDWTANHKLNGICYIAASFDYDKKGMYKGVPQITVQVRGKKVFDPRDNSTAWSSNPALCFLDYIQSDEYGKGLATSQINMTTISAAANKCDALVDQPYYNGNYQDVTWSGNSGDNFIVINDNNDWWQNKVDEVIDIRDASDNNVITGKSITGSTRYQFYDSTQENRLYIDDTLSSSYTNEAGSARAKVKRFHCNGMVDTNNSVMENSKDLLSNMRGIFTYIDGKYELQIEDTGTASFNITSDHIIEDAGISVDYGNKDKRANKVVVEFYNANNNYELDTATVLHSASPHYYSDDGEILEIKAEFPLVTDPYIAYNLGKAILTRSRYQTSIQFLGTPELYKTNVGDIVNLEYLPLNYDGTNDLFRIEALELQADGLVSVSMIQYFDVYTWQVPSQESTTEILKIPTIGALKPPQANSIVFTDTDASPINRPTLTWTEPTDFPVKQFRVDVVDSSANNVFSKIVDTPSVDLAFLPKGSNYVANITCFNSVGIESNASAKTFTIADDPVKTTEVEMNGVTMSTVETYGAVTGKTGNFVNFTNKVNFSEIAEFEDGFIVDGGNARFENPATFVDGFTGQGLFNISQGSIQFSSYTPSTTTNNLYNVGGSLYWNGQALGTGTGDITAVVAGTNLNGGGTSGSVTLNLDSTITGNHTFSNNVIISGDLTVNGTTTTVNTNDLNVKDKNITLNYSTGDSSASANGAGITIQDAVSSTQDATLTWNTANDSFNFSHPLNVTGAIATTGNITLSSGGTQVKFTGSAGPFGLEFGDTEANPNFRLYYRTTPNTLTFENGGQTAKHTFDLDGDYTAVRDVSVGRNLDVTGNITIPTGNKVAFDTDGLTYITEDQDERLRVWVHNTEFIRMTNTTTDELRLLPYGGNLFAGGNLDVTGTTTTDGLTVNSGNTSSNISIRNGSNSSFLNIYSDLNGVAVLDVDASNVGGAPRFQVDVGSVQALRITEGGDISFYEDTGSTAKFFWDASAEKLGIGTTTVGAALTVHHALPSGNYLAEFRSTGNSHATIDLRADGTGDPRIFFDLNGATPFAIGVDNSDGDKFKISGHYQLGTNDRFVIDSSGNSTLSGTISSGAITSSGAIGNLGSQIGQQLELGNTTTATLRFDADEWRLYSGGTGSSGEVFTISQTGDAVFRGNGNLTALGTMQVYSTLYTRSNLQVLNAAGNGWNTWATRSSGKYNLSNIGTISSGAITSSGNGEFTGTYLYASGDIRVGTSTGATNQTGIIKNSGTTYGLGLFNWGDSNPIFIGGSEVNFRTEAGSAIPLKMNGTTVIDASRNLTNIGTITSSTIQVQHSGTNNISLSPTSTGGVINARNSSGTSVAVMDGRGTPFIDVTGNLKTGGTTRIDSSGNLSNIGTISSGAITSTGLTIDNEYTLPTVSGTAGQVLKYPATGSQVIWANDDADTTTINNNADNRIITGSGTANTLNAESGLTFDGATLGVVGDISLGDNKKIYLGTGNNTQIYFNGSNSYFLGAGNAYYTGSTSVNLTSGVSLGSQTYLTADYANGVKLYQSGAIKAKTTATGFDVTGTVTSDGLTVVGETTSSNGTYGTKLTYSNGNQSGIIDTFGNHNLEFRANNDRAMNIAANGDISFYEDTGTTAKLFWDASAEALGIGTTGIRSNYSLDVRNAGNSGVNIQAGDEAADIVLSVGSAGTPDKFVVTSGGSVGIGTDSPSQIFTVENNSGIFRINTSTSTYPRIEVGSASGTTAVVINRTTSTQDIKFGETSDTGNYIFRGGNLRIENGSLQIGTQTVIDSSRNLTNIGTISSGAITSSGQISISKDNPVLILNDTTSSSNANQVAYISFQDNGTEEAWIGWGSSSNTNFTINNSIGNIVLNGSTTVNAALTATQLNIKSGTSIVGTITTSSSSLALNARNTGIMLFQSGGSEKGRMDSSGRFGFGTNAPSLRIHSKDTGNYQLDLDSGGTRWRMGAGWSGYYQNHFLLADTANGVRMIIDTNGNTTFSGTISSGAITVTNPTANAPVATFTGNYTANGDVALSEWQRSGGAVKANFAYVDSTTDMEFGTTTSHGLGIKTGNTRRLTITSAGAATFAGKVTINEGNVADQLVIYRTSPSSNQVGMKFDVHGVHSRFFGVGTDGHPYWSTTADLTGAGNGVWHSGLSNFKVGTVSVLTSSRNLQNIGTISSGAITSSGKFRMNLGANPSPATTDYLYIGGDDLGGSDAAIYLGNRGNGTGYGWRFFYEGSGNGNNNKLIIKSENLGSPVDALSFTQDGNATFAGTISSGVITTSDFFKVNDSGSQAFGFFKEKTITGTGISNDLCLFAESITNGGEIHFMTGGSAAKRLTINSSGNATFSGTISSGDITTSGDLYLSEYIYHTGDTDTYIRIQDNSWTFRTGGGDRVVINNSEMTTKDINVGGTGNATVKVRHIEGKAPNSASYESLYLNYNSTYPVFIGHSGNQSDLYLSGALRIGSTAVIDYSRNLSNIASAEITGNIEMATFLCTSNATVEGTFTSEGLFTTDNKAQIEGIKSSATDAIATIKNKNSTNTNGTYLDFVDHNDNFVCSIGTRPQDNTSNSFIIGGSGSYKTGLKFLNYTTYQAIYPATGDGATADDKIDLGASSARFDDIYATNGTIQTSDRNQKQDIQALTDAEQRVATACKGLIRRFRWQDSVAEKDDNPDSDETARYHFGVIAQDLQDAFTAEGLDAGDYGMFISSTWTDDDGVEQTRLGVRYNELLAFIITTI